MQYTVHTVYSILYNCTYSIRMVYIQYFIKEYEKYSPGSCGVEVEPTAAECWVVVTKVLGWKLEHWINLVKVGQEGGKWKCNDTLIEIIT